MKRVLIYGDSNTWGYDAASYDEKTGLVKRMGEGERWPSLVRAALGEEYLVIENALNARTNMEEDPYNPLRNGLKSLKVALDANAPLDLVVIQMGCNNLKHAFSLTPGMIAYGVEQLVRECQTSYYGYPVPKVLVIAPSPTHPRIGEMLFGYVFGPEAYQKSLQLGPLYQEMAQRLGCGFVDCAPLHFELNELDGLHYSRADHAKLAPEVVKAIRKLMEE